MPHTDGAALPGAVEGDGPTGSSPGGCAPVYSVEESRLFPREAAKPGTTGPRWCPGRPRPRAVCAAIPGRTKVPPREAGIGAPHVYGIQPRGVCDPSRQNASAQRPTRQQHRPESAGQWKNPEFRLAPQQGELDCNGSDRVDAMGADQPICVHTADADVAHLPGRHQPRQLLHLFLNRRSTICRMQHIEIYVAEAQFPKRVLTVVHDFAAARPCQGALCGRRTVDDDEHLVPAGGDSLPDDAPYPPSSEHVGRVEQNHTRVNGLPHQLHCLGVVDCAVVAGESQAPQAEPVGSRNHKTELLSPIGLSPP